MRAWLAAIPVADLGWLGTLTLLALITWRMRRGRRPADAVPELRRREREMAERPSRDDVRRFMFYKGSAVCPDGHEYPELAGECAHPDHRYEPDAARRVIRPGMGTRAEQRARGETPPPLPRGYETKGAETKHAEERRRWAR